MVGKPKFEQVQDTHKSETILEKMVKTCSKIMQQVLCDIKTPF